MGQREAREKTLPRLCKGTLKQPKNKATPWQKNTVFIELRLCKHLYVLVCLLLGAFRLTDTRHMLDIVPFVLNEERARVKNETEVKFVSVIFDGTTRLGEV